MERDTYTNDTSASSVSLDDLRKVKREMAEAAPSERDIPTDLVMTSKLYHEITSQMEERAVYPAVGGAQSPTPAPMYNGMGLHKADTGKDMWQTLRRLVESGRKPQVLDSGEGWLESTRTLFNAYMLMCRNTTLIPPAWDDLEEYSRLYIEAQERL